MPEHSKDYGYKPLLITKETKRVYWCEKCGNYIPESTSWNTMKAVCKNLGNYQCNSERESWKQVKDFGGVPVNGGR